MLFALPSLLLLVFGATTTQVNGFLTTPNVAFVSAPSARSINERRQLSSGATSGEAGDSTTFFNGGKMQHLFQFGDNYKYNKDGMFSSPEAEQALLGGNLYYKIDGSNGMIVSKNDDIRVFQRHDTRGKGNTMADGKVLTNLPEGKNPATYKDHTYFMQEVTTDVTGKKLSKRNRAMLDLAKRHKDRLLSFGREWLSVEWVGKKFQQTPGVDHDVALAVHEDQVLTDGEIDRTFKGVQKYLMDDCSDAPIEGIIVAHHGVYWKVVTGGFSLPEGVAKDPFSANKANARAPIFLV